MTVDTRWPDAAIDREFNAVWKAINGMPDRLVRVEEALKAIGNRMQDLHEAVEDSERIHRDEIAALRKEIRESRKPAWTRGERLSAAGVSVAFFATLASVLTTVL